MRKTPRALFLASLLEAACSTDGGHEPAVGTDATGDDSSAGTAATTSPSDSNSAVPLSTDVGSSTAGDPTTGTGTSTNSTSTTTDTTAPPTCSPGVPTTSQIPRLRNLQYDNAIRDLLGVTGIASEGNQPPSALLYDDLEGALNDIAWNAYQVVADKIAAQVMATDRSPFMTCEPSEADCLESTIRTFGRKAFRRAVTNEEVASFMSFDALEPKGTPEDVAEAILFAFLASPSFIMLPELAETAEGSAFKLSGDEVATRLALLIWGSIPDQDLRDAADAGLLDTKEQILQQALRMVAVKDKVAPLMAAYHSDYAGIHFGSHWWEATHELTEYPLYTTGVASAMQQEIDTFFAEVASTGTFKDLFLSNKAYVNKHTAPIYGLNAADFGEELEPVELNATERPGYLTRIGFLSSFSKTSSSSPILRGAYIFQNAIGGPMQAPDPEFFKTVIEDNYTTERDYVQALTDGGKCKGCHHPVINPPGFVMEAYDAIGALQTKDKRGGDINTKATVIIDGAVEVNTPAELMAAIAASKSAQTRYAKKWVEFATGRQMNSYDQCTVEALLPQLSDANYTISQLLAELSQADSFRLRAKGN